VKKKIFGILFALVLVVSLTLVPAFADDSGAVDTDSDACTDILVGNEATVDGSTIGTYSCDGPPFPRIEVVPGETYKPGTMMSIYCKPSFYPGAKTRNYEQWLEYIAEEPVLLAEIPQVEETYRYVDIYVQYDGRHVGGINEYGLTTGETTIGGRSELRNENGLMFAYSDYRESSLLVLALQRAKTAREAIQVMGSLAEEYGYIQSGEHITVSDGNEVWAFEIFGPGEDWTLGSLEPGALWCAQRIPDGEVGVSANRSRIGEIDLDDPDYFMASPNVYSFAEDMGWWDGTSTFVWYEAYGPKERRSSIIREWRVLSLVAPSLGLPPPPSTGEQRYPFSVEPDELLSVQDVMALHRDTLEGTPYDVTEDPAFYLDGEKSPLACPWGPRNLHKLLGVSSERVVGTSSSTFTYVSQVRADLPDPIKGCLWFGSAQAPITCYAPVYSGVTELPEGWYDMEFNQVSRANPWWAFTLVINLAFTEYQNAIEDVKGVRDPAEATFFAQQPEMESVVQALYDSNRSEVAAQKLAEKLVTNYTNSCMNAISDGYWELVDYMLLKYCADRVGGALLILPTIECPPVPTNPGK